MLESRVYTLYTLYVILFIEFNPSNSSSKQRISPESDLPIWRLPREYLEALVLIRVVVVLLLVVLLVLVLRLLLLLRCGGEGMETSRMPRDVPVAC